MTGYILKLAGAAIAVVLVAAIAIVIFEDVWARVGIGAALAVVFGGLLVFAWYVDRKDKAKRQGLEDLPPV